MDVLAEFLPFLLLILYAVLRALRGRNRPQQPAPQPDTEGSPQRQTDLDELARHLEALMTGVPVDEKLTPPPPPEPRYEPEFHNAEVAVDESASFQHQRHGFGPENPLSEETFERQPAFVRVPRPRDTPAFDPHQLKRRAPQPPAPASRWRTRLADPQRAREAFVLKTILERPSKRRR